LKVLQFRYGLDNLSYVVHASRAAAAIDGGAVEEILEYLKSEDLELRYVTNTHSHPDHTMGTQELQSATGATHLGYDELLKAEALDLDEDEIRVIPTPGHTLDSVVFYTGSALISGDTLFSGTVGNCFSGDLKGFLASIKKLMEYPDETVIYAGHDYVHEAMEATLRLEPDNPDVDAYLDRFDPTHVRSTLREEYPVNRFLRFNHPKIVSLLQARGLPVDTELRRWESLWKTKG
jgi:hydroxyacylglutathione hydrolase